MGCGASNAKKPLDRGRIKPSERHRLRPIEQQDQIFGKTKPEENNKDAESRKNDEPGEVDAKESAHSIKFKTKKNFKISSNRRISSSKMLKFPLVRSGQSIRSRKDEDDQNPEEKKEPVEEKIEDAKQQSSENIRAKQQEGVGKSLESKGVAEIEAKGEIKIKEICLEKEEDKKPDFDHPKEENNLNKMDESSSEEDDFEVSFASSDEEIEIKCDKDERENLEIEQEINSKAQINDKNQKNIEEEKEEIEKEADKPDEEISKEHAGDKVTENLEVKIEKDKEVMEKNASGKEEKEAEDGEEEESELFSDSDSLEVLETEIVNNDKEIKQRTETTPCPKAEQIMVKSEVLPQKNGSHKNPDAQSNTSSLNPIPQIPKFELINPNEDDQNLENLQRIFPFARQTTVVSQLSSRIDPENSKISHSKNNFVGTSSTSSKVNKIEFKKSYPRINDKFLKRTHISKLNQSRASSRNSSRVSLRGGRRNPRSETTNESRLHKGEILEPEVMFSGKLTPKSDKMEFIYHRFGSKTAFEDYLERRLVDIVQEDKRQNKDCKSNTKSKHKSKFKFTIFYLVLIKI